MADDTASTDPMGVRPWRTNRSRMMRELSLHADRLSDALQHASPGGFDADIHGLSLERGLLEAVRMVGHPEQFPNGLVTLQASTPHAQTGFIAAAVHQVVRGHRDQLIQETRDLKTEVTRLRAETAQLGRSSATGSAAASSSDAVDAALDRASTAEHRAALLEADLASRQQSLDDVMTTVASYAALGTPGEIEDRLDRLGAMAALARTMAESTESACTQYEAAFGPFVLALERSDRTIASMFSTLAGRMTPSDHTILRTLLPGGSGLAATDAPQLALSGAIDVIRSDRATVAGVIRQVFRDRELPSQALADSLLALRPRVTRSLQRQVLSEPAVSAAYTLLLQTARSSDTTSASTRATRLTRSSTLTGGPGSSDQHPLSDALDPSDAQGASTGSLAADFLRLARDNVSVERTRPKHMSKKRLLELRKICDERLKSRAAAFAEAHPDGSADPWPVGPPTLDDFPAHPAQLREIPWQFFLMEDERWPPTNQEHRALLRADEKSYRLVDLDEANRLYASEPWAVLTDPPHPRSFDPFSGDATLRAFYDKTVALYQQDAQVLWERTHFLLLDSASVASRRGDTQSASAFYDARRARNSRHTHRWDIHLAEVQSMLSVVGLDLLLDPFLYWPPAYGVVLLLPEDSDSLGSCVTAADLRDPARLYFRTPGGIAAHRAAFGIEGVHRLTSSALRALPSVSSDDSSGTRDRPVVVDSSGDRRDQRDPSPRPVKRLRPPAASSGGDSTSSGRVPPPIVRTPPPLTQLASAALARSSGRSLSAVTAPSDVVTASSAAPLPAVRPVVSGDVVIGAASDVVVEGSVSTRTAEAVPVVSPPSTVSTASPGAVNGADAPVASSGLTRSTASNASSPASI
jgi:hypothetical protein